MERLDIATTRTGALQQASHDLRGVLGGIRVLVRGSEQPVVALRPRPIDEADLDEDVMQHEIRRRLPGLDGDAFPDAIVQDDPGGLSDGDAVLCPSRAGRGATPCGAR